MKTISAALQQKIAAGVIPTMTGTLTQENGTALSLTGADFMENTFAFSEATTNEGSFDIGCAIIGSFGFALNNFDGKFNSFDFTNAYIDPVLDYGGGDTLTMKRYYLAKHKTAGKAIRCESYDGMKFLDEYVVNLTYPITCAAAVAQIASECGVTLATAAFPNSTYTLTEEVSEVTARTLLAYIAQVCGCFAIFRNNGLHLEWYPSTASGTVATTFSAPNISTSDITITGLLVYPYGKTDEPAQIGTDDYMIVIDNNPFITPDNQSTIAANIWAQLNGMTFRAGSVDILSNPALEAGDTVAVTIGGSTITMLFSTVMYKKMLRQRLQCDAVAEEESDMRTGSAITAGDLAKILTVNGINADWIKSGIVEIGSSDGYKYVITGSGAYIENPSGEIIAQFASDVWLGAVGNNSRLHLKDAGLTAFSSESVPYFRIGTDGALVNVGAQYLFTGSDQEPFGYINSNKAIKYTSTYTNIPSSGSASISGTLNLYALTQFSNLLAISGFTGSVTRTAANLSISLADITLGTSVVKTASVVIDTSNNIPFTVELEITYDADENTITAKLLFTVNGTVLFNGYDMAVSVDTTILAGSPSFTLGTRSDIQGSEGSYSTAIGENIYSASDHQTAIGKNNVQDTQEVFAFIIGNGNSDSDRSNAMSVDWTGNIQLDLDTSRTATASIDYALYEAILSLNWENEVIN